MVFIPIRDINQRIWIRFHYVTLSLMAVCIAVFVAQLAGGQQGFRAMLFGYGVIPAVLFSNRELDPALVALPAIATLVSSLFLHGGFMHLIGNMLFLWVFGDNVEDSMGHLRFLVFYLICGTAAALVHALSDPGSTSPLIGASGAISGVLGAYFVLHPRVKVWVLMFAWLPMKLPTFLILGLWAVLQFGNSLVENGATGGVAWSAHVAGFIAGAALIPLFKYPHVKLFDTSSSGAIDVSGLKLRPRHRWGSW